MKSPFEYGRIVTDERFVNHEKTRSELTSYFENGRNVTILSPRRWGKTSLVQKVASTLSKKRKGIRFVFIDLFGIRSEEAFFNQLAEEVLKATSSKFEDIYQSITATLKGFIPQISFGIDPLTDLKLHFTWTEREENYRDILQMPEELAKAKNIKLVICIDEFQDISNLPDASAFQKLLRSVWQTHEHVSYCLYGSKQHLMMELFYSQSMPFWNFGPKINLPKISETDWVNYIQRSFKKTGKTISKPLASRITQITECHSYYTQQLGDMVWTATDKAVTEKLIDEALSDLLVQNEILYQRDFDNLSNTQVNFLVALINGEEKFTSKRVLQQYDLGSSSNITRIKEALEQKEILDTFLTPVDFLDPMFKLWFQKRIVR